MENLEISVLLAKTDPLMCQMLVDLLNNRHYQVYYCHSENEILPILQQHAPTVVFVGHDIAQDGNSLALAVHLKAQFLALRFVLFTKIISFEDALAALVAEIDGYLFYNDGLTAIYDCIDSVARGTPYFSPSAQKVLSEEEPAPTAPALSVQEAKVMALVKQKHSNREMAELLCISPLTVQDHRRNVRRKLGIKGGKNILLQYLKLTPPRIKH